MLPQAAGEIPPDGQAVRFDSPTAAQHADIFAVCQTINLISGRSAAERAFFGHEPHLCGIAWRPMKAQPGRDGALRHSAAQFLTRRE
ncbi:hypothetical protein [Paraburkholderia sp. BL10I2N1]|uniref:hypothetical protein n=1 Tax=Paraburkholderia sp. BL10I2N1 TaxID=1938796 RepID=UPI00105CFEEC|nr:hypothetical protein [Paraburkholderia sp. BL10I2N1]